MADTLVIVESPSKAKTIEKYLGSKYKVIASNGHVRDLPKSQIGVDIENGFAPKYITMRGRGEVIEKIKKEAKAAKRILLATDPDREGEAISWHLAHMLKMNINEPCRVVFNEITKKVVLKSISEARPIDLSLVNAQQARRVLDRLVGYKISPLLWAKVRKGLSAGRVQSVATKIVCDREREILDFVSKEYWTINAKLNHAKKTFEAKFFGIDGKKLELSCQSEAESIISATKSNTLYVSDVKVVNKLRHAAPPYTTSSMLQDASSRAGLAPKRTMLYAQSLYEGINVAGRGSIGLITYMRTDSVRVSAEALNSVREHIVSAYGDRYLPEKPNFYKGRAGAQDAHEAIRPTEISLTPESIKGSLDAGQYKLYKLIYDRFVASQMKPAEFEVTTATIQTHGDTAYTYKATGTIKLFDGFTAAYADTQDGADSKTAALPKLKENDEPKLVTVEGKQNFTEPPSRFTEASLVKALEEQGIGRPSTYSATISTIVDRGYVDKQKKLLVPTELGFIVNKLMEDSFADIVNVKFTANMENRLDTIEEGKEQWQSLVSDFYKPFEVELEKAFKEVERVVIKDEVSDTECEKCGAMMVYKIGRFGRFLACPNYPECKNTKTIVEKIGVACPKCGKDIIKRRGKKGKSFYGCVGYPDCDYVSWDMPVQENCPRCGKLLVQKFGPRGKYIMCADKECGYTQRKAKTKDSGND